MKVRKVNDVAIVAPEGWLMGGSETVEFEQTVERVFQSGNRRLVIDLAGVEMMNSTAIGALTHCRARYAEAGGQVTLCNLDRRLDQIFVITKLCLVFDSYASEREAIEAFGQPA